MLNILGKLRVQDINSRQILLFGLRDKKDGQVFGHFCLSEF